MRQGPRPASTSAGAVRIPVRRPRAQLEVTPAPDDVGYPELRPEFPPMLQIAIRSLVHDRTKVAGAIAGVASAAALIVVHTGLFVGFLDAASAIVRRVGGDVWVMQHATEVLDNAEPLRASSRDVVAAHPCAATVRGLVVAVVPMRKPSGAIDYAELIGVEPGQVPPVPWSLVRGRAEDLSRPLRVAIDEREAEKLQIPGDPLRATLEVARSEVSVVALTRGIRSFALYPYLFTSIDNARRVAGMQEGEAQYWVVEARDAACVGALVRDLARDGLAAHPTAAFATMTESYWVFGTGAGAALAWSALFAFVVGAVIVGQTIHAVTREHLRELATLKAMGATAGELLSLVAWQSAVLSAIGGSLGLGVAAAIRSALSSQGIGMILSPAVIGCGLTAVFVMCALACAPSARTVFRVEAAEVFR